MEDTEKCIMPNFFSPTKLSSQNQKKKCIERDEGVRVKNTYNQLTLTLTLTLASYINGWLKSKEHFHSEIWCTSHEFILIKNFVPKDVELCIMIIIEFKHISTCFVCSLDSTRKSTYFIWTLLDFSDYGSDLRILLGKIFL
jgi:hypothetical protein